MAPSTLHSTANQRFQPLRTTLSALLCLYALGIAAAHAESLQSLESIRQAAEMQIRQLSADKVGTLFVAAETLDPRLRLPQCFTELESFLPSGANLGARATVAVRCTQGAQWTLYVPVNIATEAPVLTLLHNISKDSLINADDVSTASRRVPGLRSGYLTDASQLKEQRARRNLTAGTVLTPDMLLPALMIKRGQEVTLLASVNGIEVRSQGLALSDGSANERIQVRNSSTSKVVEGVVDSSSVVRVLL